MAVKMKMLGVRVPENSNVPERLKARSLDTRMAYYELIEQWLDRDEREKGQPLPETPTPNDNLESRIAELENFQTDIIAHMEGKIEEHIQKILQSQDKRYV
jgi:hypothetical protein